MKSPLDCQFFSCMKHLLTASFPIENQILSTVCQNSTIFYQWKDFFIEVQLTHNILFTSDV